MVTLSWGLHSLCLGWGFHLMFVPVAFLCRAQLYLQMQTVSHCIALCSPPCINNTACVSVIVMTKQLWLWCFEMLRMGRWWIANARNGQSQGEFPVCILGGWGTLWCVSSFKITALCLKARCDSCGGERGEKWSSGVIVMEMYWPFGA